MDQTTQSARNQSAWSARAYEAWVSEMGNPVEQATKFQADPRYPLRRHLKYIGDPAGKRILNPLGSHGGRAVPLAILGADVTVIDISEANKRYAEQVAAAAGVSIRYICSDFLKAPVSPELMNFDVILMELGILHYFTDLDLLFTIINRFLHDKGRLLLTDFHPVAGKLLHSEKGDYFDSSFVEETVAYTSLLPTHEQALLPKVLLRKWTVGEILNALAKNGMYVRLFDEEPDKENPKIPRFFNIVADKVSVELEPLTP
ncbi:class I SAM-dependent methyltransferase [Alicyclobacillus fodiniaquatilis]|uniref:Class I SAM-dependent methyltransferase n=1 Tax=Alicyclobacillus fodiniaquatilis TaxID=1661150 RepID=A0ABW4JJT4_9BACL